MQSEKNNAPIIGLIQRNTGQGNIRGQADEDNTCRKYNGIMEREKRLA